MKKPIAVAFLTVLAVACNAQQQSTASPGQPQQPALAKPMQRTAQPQHMAQELGLSEQQVADLNRLDQEHAARMRELHGAEMTSEAKRARSQELRDRHESDMRTVMSEAQWGQWLQAKQKARDAAYGNLKERKEQPTHQE